MREALSVVVTTLNNAATLERCLASVAWAEEIVLLDSGSTDATLAIVRLLEDRVLRERLGASADRLVREQYDWRAVAPCLLDVYRELA